MIIRDKEFNNPEIIEVLDEIEKSEWRLGDANRVYLKETEIELVRVGFIFIEGRWKYFINENELTTEMRNYIKSKGFTFTTYII